MFFWISCQWSLYSSLLAHPAEAYPSFLNRKRLVLLGYDASQSQGLPPAFYQAFLTIGQYPLILLGEERHCKSEVFAQEHNILTQLGLEPRPLDLKSSALTIRPLCLSNFNLNKCLLVVINNWVIWLTSYLLWYTW